jgi:gamma-glutamylcyclotransferase (GGCT)/AIG2-like uncharacterized protein YtfP
MPRTATHSRRTTSRGSGQKDRLSAAPENLFVYGSLLFPDVLLVLIDRVPDSTPVVASGWRVAALPGAVYPGLMPGDGEAHGHLLTNLTAEEWRTIDAFEDDLYELRQLSMTDGRRGWAYTCPQEPGELSENWDKERFAIEHLPQYVNRCRAWRRRYEAP